MQRKKRPSAPAVSREEAASQGKSMPAPKFSLEASAAETPETAMEGKLGADQEKDGPKMMGSMQAMLPDTAYWATSPDNIQAISDYIQNNFPGMNAMFGGAANPAAGDSKKIKHKTVEKAPDGSPDERKQVGVGEAVVFTSTADGQWTASAGSPKNQANGKTFVWQAPNRGGTATISLQTGGKTETVQMNVVEPQDVKPKKYGEMSIPAGKMGAGMYLYFDYFPRTVSFLKVEAGEKSGPASGVTGYFERFPFDQLGHESGDTFFGIDRNNRLSVGDVAWATDWPEPWEDGEMHWIIPNRFRVIGEGGEGKVFDHMDQGYHIQRDGTFTVTKDTESVTRKVNP